MRSREGGTATMVAPPTTKTAAEEMFQPNYVSVPVNKVLSDLSARFGFVLVGDRDLAFKITFQSERPLTASETITRLNDVLKPQHYTALRIETASGRTILHIVGIAGSWKELVPEN